MAVPISADRQGAHLHTRCAACGAHGLVRLRTHEAHAVATTLLSWVSKIPQLEHGIPEGVGGKWWKQ